MALRDILLDTNAYVAFKQGRPEAVEIIQHTPHIILCSVVLGELLAGFAAGTREIQNRGELQQFLLSERVLMFPIDKVTAEYYATVYRTLRAKGRPVPTNDMWIAATAFQYGCAVFTYDSHFKHFDSLIIGTTYAELQK